MPLVSLSAGAFRENTDVDRFASFSLEKGEAYRLWVPSQDYAWMEYKHQIKAPVFLDDGAPLMTERKGNLVFDMGFKVEGAFIGGPICLGDPDIRAKQELDPGNCPVCAGVKRLADAGVGEAVKDLKPQQRYALPVIQYETVSTHDNTKLRTPPNAKILVWGMAQYTWEQVDAVRKSMKELLRVEDQDAIKLSQCDIGIENENGFGQIDKIYGLHAAWSYETDNGRRVKQMLRELWGTEENRPTEAQLRAACGREPNREWMDRDIRAAEERWTKAVNWGRRRPADPTGNGSYLSDGNKAQDLSAALDELDGTAPASVPASPLDGLDEFAATAPQGKAAPADDPFGAPAPSPAAVPAQAPSLGDIFDDANSAAPPAARTQAPSMDDAFDAPPGQPAAQAAPAGDDDPFESLMREAG